ncbi:MAG: TonB-dependent receptor [Verrucomicrobia bacterium]|nr:TonB-dependent receptor [Verrucomicrobiota bacterium]
MPPSARGQVAENPFGKVPNTDFKSSATAFAIGTPLRKVQWTLGYHRFGSDYGVPLDGHTHGNPFGTSVGWGPSPLDAVRIQLLQEQWIVQASLNEAELLRGDDNNALKVTLAHTTFDQEEREGAFLINAFGQRKSELNLEAEHKGGMGLSRLVISTGINDYTNRNLYYIANRVDEDYLATRTQHAGVALVHSVELGKLAIMPAARIDLQKSRRTDRDDFARSAWVHGVGLDIRYRWSPMLETQLHLSETRRIPHAEELFIEAPHAATGIFLIPDPDLENEKALLIELSQQVRSRFGTLRLQVYRRAVSNYIFAENLGFEVEGLTAHSYVQRAALFRGIEAVAVSEWWQTALWGQFQLRVFADYMRGEDQDRDMPLPRIAPGRVGVAGDFRWGGLQGRISVTRTMAQNRVPPGIFGTLAHQTTSPAFTLLDITISRSWEIADVTYVLTLSGSNLLNETVRNHSSFLKDVAPQPGRSIGLEFGFRF